MFPAVFSRTYPMKDVGLVLSAIREDGFAGAQMNLSSFGLDSLPSLLPNGAAEAGRAEAARYGLTLAALSGTYNMAHPDQAQRHAMRPRFVNVLRAAKAMGTRIVSLCTGSRDANNMWAAHPDNGSSEAWTDFCLELDWALDQAAQHDILLAIEPEPSNVVRDAKVARHLLEDVGSDRLKIILDAANLIGPEGLDRQRDIMAEAMDLIGPEVVLAHAKDIDATGQVVAPGAGAIDLAAFVALLRRGGFDGALIGHGFAAAHTREAAVVLRALCAGSP